MKRKLAWFGFAFALAELFAAYMPPLVLLPAAAFFALLFFVCRKNAVCIPFCGALCGVVFFALFFWLTVRPVTAHAGQTASCTVVVETDATGSYQEGLLRGTLLVTEYNGVRTHFRVRCNAFPAATPGDCFAAQWQFTALNDDAYQMNSRSQGVYLQAEYLGGFIPQPSSHALRFVLFRLRQNLSQKLQTWMPKTEGTLETALLLGDKDNLPDSVQDTFRAAGVSHLLAVSGLHVALLCGIFSMGFRRRFVRPLILFRAILVIFYMLLTGLPVSVLRAGLVFLLTLAGDFFLQPADLLTSTGAAAILIGLQNAYAPCDVGFQLSFCAVLGVQLAGALFEWECNALPVPTRPWLAKLTSGCLFLLDTVQVAFFAGLATLPVLVAQGMSTCGVGVLTNLLVVWMLEFALRLGIAILALSLLPPLAPVMHMASLLLSGWLHAMFLLVSWCAELPLAQLHLPRQYTLLVLGVLALLAVFFWMTRQFVRYLPAVILCTCTAIIFGFWAQKDVVRIALVGAANNPCAVCIQNGNALVLFRGGQSNLRAVSAYLAEQSSPDVSLLVDLRQKPSTLDFGNWPVLSMDTLADFYSQNTLDGLCLDLYHDGSGNLAVLGVGDRHIAWSVGQPALDEPVLVDVFCSASSLPEKIQPQTIVTCTMAPSWLAQSSAYTVYYSGETPVIVIRPNASITYEEVDRLALQ